MPAFNLDAWVARSGALDLSAVAWEDTPRYPAYPETILMGSRVQPPVELNFMAQLLEAWMDRNIGRSSSVSGGHNGYGHN